MSLSLDGLIWVIPGIFFLFSYNRLRDVESSIFGGWPFAFFIVLIGAVTFFPTMYFLGYDSFKEIKDIYDILWICIPASIFAFFIPFLIKFFFYDHFDKRLEKDPNFFESSSLWSIIYFFFPLENKDKFIKNCIECEGKPILLTVDEPILLKLSKSSPDDKNSFPVVFGSTIYFCILVEFPYVETSVTDSHVIRVLPMLSGYKYIEKRDGKGNKNEKMKIKWTQYYEIHKDSEGLVIPRKKIINFSLYDAKNHETLVFDDN